MIPSLGVRRVKQKFFKAFSEQTSWIIKDNLSAPIKEIVFKFKKELIIVIPLIFAMLLFLF